MFVCFFCPETTHQLHTVLRCSGLQRNTNFAIAVGGGSVLGERSVRRWIVRGSSDASVSLLLDLTTFSFYGRGGRPHTRARTPDTDNATAFRRADGQGEPEAGLPKHNRVVLVGADDIAAKGKERLRCRSKRRDVSSGSRVRVDTPPRCEGGHPGARGG